MSGTPEQALEAGRKTQFGKGGAADASAAGAAGASAVHDREVLNDSDILDLVARSVKHLRGVMTRKSVNQPKSEEDDVGGVAKERVRRLDALAARRDKIALEVVKTYIGPNVVTRLTDNARARNAGKSKGTDKGKGMGASVVDAAAASAPEGNA